VVNTNMFVSRVGLCGGSHKLCDVKVTLKISTTALHTDIQI